MRADRRCISGSIRQDKEGAVMATEINQPAGYAPDSYEFGQTGWTGWIAFAGVMMIIGGGLNALYGLVAVVNDEWVVWTTYSSSGLSLAHGREMRAP
jgi:hypothetical protein